MLNDRKNHSRWFVAGLGLGALAGVLLAPKTGCETRKAIAAGVDDGVEHLASLGRDARRQMSHVLGSGKKFFTRKKEQAGATIDAVKVFLTRAA